MTVDELVKLNNEKRKLLTESCVRQVLQIGGGRGWANVSQFG